ncbi:MAG: DUF2304 domain-containing protein [Anaerolineae bacterium]|nr:DUF2304 domain-containing protein [Anaerolineae bacterium]
MTIDRVTLFGLIASVGGLILIIELVRRGKLREDYSLLWLATGVVLIALTVSRPLLDQLASLLGVITYPPAAIFLVAIIFMLLILLHFSTALTKLARENKKIAQEMALLRQELEIARGGLSVQRQPGNDQSDQQGAKIE